MEVARTALSSKILSNDMEHFAGAASYSVVIRFVLKGMGAFSAGKGNGPGPAAS